MVTYLKRKQGGVYALAGEILEMIEAKVNSVDPEGTVIYRV